MAFSRPVVAAGLSAAAAAILIALLFTSWYTVTSTGNSALVRVTVTTQLQPGNTVTTASSCAGGPVGLCSHSNSNTTNYDAVGLGNTGRLYQMVQYLLLGGLALAVAASVYTLATGSRSDAARATAVVLIGVGMALVASAPVMLLIVQPYAMHEDPAFSHVTASSSFFGSCEGSSCGSNSTPPGPVVTASWGPALGWYLSFVAASVLAGALAFAAYKPGQSVVSPP